jgi:LmbE family N-acetylglucosaminyl deacetylase
MAVVQTVISSKFPAQVEDFEGWNEPKRILVILAHPDDPEFFCGATLIRWAAAGHEIRYCLLTKGQRGSKEQNLTGEEIARMRMTEQKNAATYIGIKSVDFLDELDGELEPSQALRKEIVRQLRKFAPQVIVTSDPQNYVSLENKLNHPDHRAAGEIVLGAAFPAAGNPLIYRSFDDRLMGGPVNPEEVWISATNQPNLIVDVSPYFGKKLEALCCHKSQIGEPDAFILRMKERAVLDPETKKQIYVERFKRVIL